MLNTTLSLKKQANGSESAEKMGEIKQEAIHVPL